MKEGERWRERARKTKKMMAKDDEFRGWMRCGEKKIEVIKYLFDSPREMTRKRQKKQCGFLV